MKTKGHISIIEFSETYGSIEIEKVAIFNENMISEEEAIRLIHLAEYNPNILVMDKKQWVQIFCDGKDE